ncbi:MAG: hypothetical protein M3256_04230 [Actinomycetota bacterium]|nr:hypothetical protein [Actinomycetota bacterium]
MSPEAASTWAPEKVTVASGETTVALLANEKIRGGLRAYFDRYERYSGDIPTISGEELDARLSAAD